LQLHELLAHLPLIVRLGKLIDALIVQFGLLLLGETLLLFFLLLELGRLLFLIDVVLDNYHAVVWPVHFIGGDPVNQVDFAVFLECFYIVKLQKLLPLSL